MATKKGPAKGTGGHGRRKLAGKGPTPKAEDRVYHKAYKAKQAKLRREAVQPKRRRKDPGSDIIAGRKQVSDWDGAVQTYMSGGGTQICAELTEAYAKANG